MNVSHTTAYRITVNGKLWSGHSARQEYTLDKQPEPEDIKRLTGDFQSVSRYRVYETETVRCQSTKLIRNGVNLK